MPFGTNQCSNPRAVIVLPLESTCVDTWPCEIHFGFAARDAVPMHLALLQLWKLGVGIIRPHLDIHPFMDHNSSKPSYHAQANNKAHLLFALQFACIRLSLSLSRLFSLCRVLP